MKIETSLYACAILVSSLVNSASAQLINEFQPNPIGSDPTNVTFEFLGTPGASFDGYLSSIENDGINGTLDRLNSISGTFDSNGLATVVIPDLENPSNTLVFSSLDPSNTLGTGIDLDVDDDGFIDDIGVFGTIYDAIGIADSVTDATTLYASQLGGINPAYTGDEPKLAFRDGVTNDWYFINDPAGTDAYDAFGNTVAFADFSVNPESDTFGSVNPNVVPEPSTYALLAGLATLGFVAIRRRK